MKIVKILFLVLFVVILGCSKDDDAAIVGNGVNRTSNLQTTGSSANDFLAATAFNTLIVEVLYVQNFRPNAQTLVNLKSFMEARLNKPGGISIVEREIASPGTAPYDINEIAAVEGDNRTFYNNAGTLALSILFVDGGVPTDTSDSFTLGSAYRNTSCVIYEASIKNLSDSPTEPSRTDLETTVILHEICHLLGLVNLGTPMQTEHLDVDHDKHCDNENCLMFWETENSNVLAMMLGGSIPILDANCIADLQANGGK